MLYDTRQRWIDELCAPVLQIIRDNPGIKTIQIQEKRPMQTLTGLRVNQLTYLREVGKIENRHGRWFLKE